MKEIEWKKYSKDNLPKQNQWIIGYNHKWIDEDFNEEGIRFGFFTEPDMFWFTGFDSYFDSWESFNSEDSEDNLPEYWIEAPIFKMQKENGL